MKGYNGSPLTRRYNDLCIKRCRNGWAVHGLFRFGTTGPAFRYPPKNGLVGRRTGVLGFDACAYMHIWASL